MTITPETSLDHRYLLVRRLAFGGMGEVWEGSDVVLDRPVAVKILRAELADDDAFRRRFRAEARTAGRVPHPGIAAVYDYGETTVEGRSLAYLVMELVPGEALSALLAREGALGADRTLDIVAQAGRALHAAHERGVIHRDVKPANLMVTPDGRVKVTDFGIARPDDHEPLTATGQVMGTAHYLAPELARGRAATAASDIYALGVVAYECLAGRRPFEGDDQIGVATAHLSEEPPPLPETIAPEVRALVAAAMEKDPQRRIAGADTFAAAAESLRLRLYGNPPTTGGLANGTGGLGAAPTVFGIGAAGALGGVAALDHGLGLQTPPPGAPPYASPPFGASPAGGSAPLGTPPPGATTAAGAPLGSGGLGGSPASGYQRPPTAPLPVLGEGGARPAGRRVRSVSLPMIALVGLVAAVVIGTLVVALRQSGSGDNGGAPQTPTSPSVSTSHRPSRTSTTPSTSVPVVPGGGGQTTASTTTRGTPTPSKSAKPSPTPKSSSSPSPSASARPSPSPTPTGAGTTSPSPTVEPPPPTSPARGLADGDARQGRSGLRWVDTGASGTEGSGTT
jgi:tRNA A-37 threonylcarbamoyl transferase component Bud32